MHFSNLWDFKDFRICSNKATHTSIRLVANWLPGCHPVPHTDFTHPVYVDEGLELKTSCPERDDGKWCQCQSFWTVPLVFTIHLGDYHHSSTLWSHQPYEVIGLLWVFQWGLPVESIEHISACNALMNTNSDVNLTMRYPLDKKCHSVISRQIEEIATWNKGGINTSIYTMTFKC